MFDFFDQVVGYIEVFFDYLSGIVAAFVNFLVLVPQSTSFALSLVGFMPSIIGTAIISVIGVSIIKLIVGR